MRKLLILVIAVLIALLLFQFIVISESVSRLLEAFGVGEIVSVAGGLFLLFLVLLYLLRKMRS